MTRLERLNSLRRSGVPSAVFSGEEMLVEDEDALSPAILEGLSMDVDAGTEGEGEERSGLRLVKGRIVSIGMLGFNADRAAARGSSLNAVAMTKNSVVG